MRCARGAGRAELESPEVSRSLTMLLPSSFQGSLGPRESLQKPRRSLVGGVKWGLPPAPWRPSDPGHRVEVEEGAFLKTQNSAIPKVAFVLTLAQSSQTGEGRERQDSPKLPWSQFSILGLGVSTAAAAPPRALSGLV